MPMHRREWRASLRFPSKIPAASETVSLEPRQDEIDASCLLTIRLKVSVASIRDFMHALPSALSPDGTLNSKAPRTARAPGRRGFRILRENFLKRRSDPQK